MPFVESCSDVSSRKARGIQSEKRIHLFRNNENSKKIFILIFQISGIDKIRHYNAIS